MDWILIGSIVIAGWVMLSVFSGERLRKAQQAALQLAAKAAEQAAVKDSEIPIARASEGPVGSIGNGVPVNSAKPRKAA